MLREGDSSVNAPVLFVLFANDAENGGPTFAQLGGEERKSAVRRGDRAENRCKRRVPKVASKGRNAEIGARRPANVERVERRRRKRRRKMKKRENEKMGTPRVAERNERR